jgi:phospholipid N-methyltransferase
MVVAGRDAQLTNHDAQRKNRRTGSHFMKQFVSEHLQFFREYVRRFETTGAVVPSSRFLARALTRPLRERSDPVRVLEVGPGTGAVTRAIVRHIKPGDRLDLVEINERFADLLKERFAADPIYRHVADCAEVHVCPLQQFSPAGRYDVIVSGLPFNNFPAVVVAELLDLCLELLNPGGTLSFFEYMYVRPIRRLVAGSHERTRLAEIERILQERFSRNRFHQDWVFVNVPPAWVQHLRSAGAPEVASNAS